MIAPASIVVTIGIVLPIAILLRYSLNQYTPAKMMVDAVTTRELREVLHRSILRSGSSADNAGGGSLYRDLRGARISYGVLSRAHALALQEPAADGHHPAAVRRQRRPRGRMDGPFRQPRLRQRIADGMGHRARAAANHVYRVAVVVGIIAVNLPFVVLTLQAVLEGIDRAIEEAAQGLGAGPWRTFRHVILPLAMPGVVAGTVLSFILAMNAYATPVLLGGPTFQMMGPTVYNQFTGFSTWAFFAAYPLSDDGHPALDRHFQLGAQRRYRH